jgi:Holliday junction resolvasome RuvABC endonuclease subunit
MKRTDYYFDIVDNLNEKHTIMPVELSKVKGTIEYPCHLFLDQSTKTGYAIVDDKRRLIRAGLIDKEDKDSLETYKYGLKDIIKSFIDEYQIRVVWYEEAYDKANHWTTEVLYYIKHMIKDLAYEYGQDVTVEEIKVFGLDHMKWKSLLAKPAKFKRTGDDKKQVRKFVNDVYPLLNLPEDTTDAIGMSIAIIWKQTEKKMYYNARINKKLPIHLEVTTVNPGDDIEDIIKSYGKRFTKKLDVNGFDYFDYVIEYDEFLNCRYVLSFRDTVCWAKIPYHRNMGMILLHYGIIPKNLKEGEEVLLIACRKK